MTRSRAFALAYFAISSLFEMASNQGLHIGWLENWMHCSGDGTGSVPYYRLLCLLLLLHLATREVKIPCRSIPKSNI